MDFDIPDDAPEIPDDLLPPVIPPVISTKRKRQIEPAVKTKRKKPKDSDFVKSFLEWENMSQGQKIKVNGFLQYFRDHPEFLDPVVQIIEGKHKVSKRILEHLVTNYAKNYKVILDGYYVVHDQYKLKLPKSNMDPCRRGERILFPYKDRFVETTLQQLESLKWVMSTNIFAYAVKHYEQIKKDLNIEKDIIPKKSTEHIILPTVENPHFVMDVLPEGYKGETTKKTVLEELAEELESF